jgi:hypothetical protein
LRTKIQILALSGVLMSLPGMNSLHAISPPRSSILVLATSQGFWTYLGEILKAEGFNDFQMESPVAPGVTAGYLREFDVILLAAEQAQRIPAIQSFLLRIRQEG